MKRKTAYLSVPMIGIVLALLFQLCLIAPATKASTNISRNATATTVEEEECGYWYFVASYAEDDERTTNTFYSCGKNLDIYYKVRLALNGFQGEITGNGPFATREEAEADKASWSEAHPNAGSKTISLSDPL